MPNKVSNLERMLEENYREKCQSTASIFPILILEDIFFL